MINIIQLYNYNTKVDNFIRNVVLTTILWIIIPVMAHVLILVKTAVDNFNIDGKVFEQQNEFADFYINILFHLRPSLETTLIDLGLIALGAYLTIYGWGKILGPISTILGIIFAIWLTSFVGFDAMLINQHTESESNLTFETETKSSNSEITSVQTQPQKLVCYGSATDKITQILSKHDISKIITYNCHLMVNDTGFGYLACPTNSNFTFQFDSIKTFETLHANLLSLENQHMIQLKQYGESKTCLLE